jgi:hypothetical protein
MNRILVSLILLFGAVTTASAGAYCAENLTAVIVNGDAVYFTTDKSCPSWCSIKSSWSVTATSRRLATLLAAKAAAVAVTFFWADQSSSCSSTEAAYASPDLLQM